jgi:Zn-dependent alcohol dehydrogenase
MSRRSRAVVAREIGQPPVVEEIAIEAPRAFADLVQGCEGRGVIIFDAP